MSKIFKDGKSIPVTLIKAGPCKVLQVKTREKDGYKAVQVGFQEITKKTQLKKPAKDKHFKHIREFVPEKEYQIGDIIEVSHFQEKDSLKVSGTSKGKGFQGGVKRWGFSGADASHGTKHNERRIGSIGDAGLQRVIKGKKMPGRMGSDRTTVINLKVVKVDSEKNIIAVKGAVPGPSGALLEIKS